jgi:hypothetical protein
VNAHHRTLTTQDAKIESANKKLKTAHASVGRAEDRLLEMQEKALTNPDNEKRQVDLDKATRAQESARKAYTKALDESVSTIGTGSGRIMVLLPSSCVVEPSNHLS